MNLVRDLGNFASIEDVISAYPSGGLSGDYVTVDGVPRQWDAATNSWEPTVPENAATPVRDCQVFTGDVDVNNNLRVGGQLRARVVRGTSAFCGLYATAQDLFASVRHPLKGQWAMVLIVNREDTDTSVGEVYYCPHDNTWQDAGFTATCDGDVNALLNERDERIEADNNLADAIAHIRPYIVMGSVSNAPDEEDLTTDDNNMLKLKDKSYQPATFSGLGRKTLRKNVVNGVNVLTQDMIAEANTIYIVQYDFTLDYELVTMPAGCILYFQGGSISNGNLRGTDTIILRQRSLATVFPNVTLFGTFIGNTDTEALMQAVANCYTKDETYSKTEIDNMMPTSDTTFVNVESESDLPEEGDPKTIYRVAGEGTFTEKAWNGTEYITLAVHDNPPVITDEQMDAALAD